MFPLRFERTLPVRGGPPRATPSANPDDAAGQEQIAAQHAAFDFQAAERAELLREHEALQALVMEQLKNEDEIMKKWIALI
jgi:hypothetical protein